MHFCLLWTRFFLLKEHSACSSYPLMQLIWLISLQPKSYQSLSPAVMAVSLVFFFFFCVYVPSPWVKTAFPAHLQSVHSSTLQFMNSGRSLAHCQFVASESGYRLCFFTFLLSCSPCVLHHCLLSTLPPSLPTPLCLHCWTPPLNICTFSFVKWAFIRSTLSTGGVQIFTI